MSQKSEKIPENYDAASRRHSNNDGEYSSEVRIENFHHYQNDLDALAELAKVDPMLAEKVVAQRDKEDERANVSYRFGIVSTVVLLTVAILSVVTMFLVGGFFLTIGSIGFLMAVAVLVRVILTGEWSESSWLGSFVKTMAKSLGSE